ncbi:MAG: hypothetical protein NTW33_07035 [Methanoregula sp.]|nr:hypothetical protein [Methanoregula sp.]
MKKRYMNPRPAGIAAGCLYCNKGGTVLVACPKKQCHHCEGIGCIYCGFTGWAGVKGKYE